MKSNREDSVLSSRLDKWLWVARFYKTRKIASDSIKKGNISIQGKTLVKPSSTVFPNNVIFIKNDYITRKIFVKKLAIVRECFEKAKKLYVTLEEENSEVRNYFNRRLKKKSSKQEKKEIIFF